MAISHLLSRLKSMATNTEGARDAIALDRTGSVREALGATGFITDGKVSSAMRQ
jgi:hypothetical protein